MRIRLIATMGLLCVACGDSNDPPQKGDNRGADSGTPGDDHTGDGDALDHGDSGDGDGDGDAPGDGNSQNVGSGPDSCTAIATQYGSSCDSGDYTMADCEDIRLLYVGEGCGETWAKYASCAATAKADCEEGDFPACRKDFSALFQCQSAWAARTSCTRLSGGDSSCPATAPYALGCLDEAPSKACVTAEDDTLCCP